MAALIEITDDAKKIWQSMMVLCNNNAYAAAGILGNLCCESGIKPMNLQNSYEKKLGMTDEEYTNKTDSGQYKNFATDGAGYGIAQWTFKSRKQNMLAAARSFGMSIGDINFQIYYLCMELQNYSELLTKLRNAETIYRASTYFLTIYEKPSNITDRKKETRYAYSNAYYEKLKDCMPDSKTIIAEDYYVLKRGSKGDDVRTLQGNLMELGYSLPDPGVDGVYGRATADAVKRFQKDAGLYADGIAGALTQDVLLNELIKKYHEDEDKPSYVVTISGLSEEEANALFEAYQEYPVTMEEEKE